MTTVLMLLLINLGVMSLGIGILGEYIGKIYAECKRRPLWLVDYTLNFPEPRSRSPGESRVEPRASTTCFARTPGGLMNQPFSPSDCGKRPGNGLRGIDRCTLPRFSIVEILAVLYRSHLAVRRGRSTLARSRLSGAEQRARRHGAVRLPARIGLAYRR